MTLPRLRPLEAYPFEENGETFYYLRDPQDFAPDPVVVNGLQYFILSLLNGKNSLQDVCRKFEEAFSGVVLSEADLRGLVEQFDGYLLLETPRYQAHLQQLFTDFRESPLRKAWHAGVCYPEDPLLLRQKITEFYLDPAGAGLEARPRSAGGYPLRAILVPHIDLRVGAPCYTHAYRDLAASTDADLFIVLGIAHSGGSGFMIASEKDFETPLGRVETDRAFLAAWEKNLGHSLCEEEFVHRSEHSIEFQLPFLQERLERPFKILPVLCGSMYSYVHHASPDIPDLLAYTESLRRTIRESGRKVFFILSVDLAHMGPKFGDGFAVDENRAEVIKKQDLDMFEVLSRLDRRNFFELVRKDLLKRNVDACGAAYTLLSLMEEGAGELVAYDQNLQRDSNSIVTYGSMLFFGPAW
ncbi:MAG TPA: AmmeMemoRadiSam system protein B [Calditrichia bacterium]|nr:AmmeMemoRadiSam system protein B [Calditrichota bacterium]HQU71400.1 AmmeMemoRadiSam system protein B [Calditrichia bacterium]HQV31609.1 AmmeMemoRadiSam system protein B [Calditrichia bacterium]